MKHTILILLLFLLPLSVLGEVIVRNQNCPYAIVSFSSTVTPLPSMPDLAYALPAEQQQEMPVLQPIKPSNKIVHYRFVPLGTNIAVADNNNILLISSNAAQKCRITKNRHINIHIIPGSIPTNCSCR